MGNHTSSEVWTKLRERTTTMTLLDLSRTASRQSGTCGLETIHEDATLQSLVSKLAGENNAAGALLVTDASGNVVNSVDLFRVVRYILHLYEGSTMVQFVTAFETQLLFY